MASGNTQTTIPMHETSVRSVVPLDNGGQLAICGLPGLEISRDGSLYLDPCTAEVTFEYLSHLGIKMLYLLMENLEMPKGTNDVLQGHAQTNGIELVWMPIVDFGAPDVAFEGEWKLGFSNRAKILDAGNGIGLSCVYGAGRSGMMACAIAVERGIPAQNAVHFVRTTFPEAVGSKQQENWVSRGDYLAD